MRPWFAPFHDKRRDADGFPLAFTLDSREAEAIAAEVARVKKLKERGRK